MFVRKEDVCDYLHPDLSLLTPPQLPARAKSVLPEPFTAVYELTMDWLNAQTEGEEVENGPRPPGSVAARTTMRELSIISLPILQWLAEEQQTRCESGVGSATDDSLVEASATFSYGELREALVGRSAEMRGLDAMLLSIDFEGNSPFGYLALIGHLELSRGPAMLRRLLDDQEALQWFWTLVHYYCEELMEHWAAACEYYEIDEAIFCEVGFGCLLYAFFVGVVCSNPRAALRNGTSLKNHEELLWECVRHWFFLLLNEAGALVKTSQGYLLLSPPIVEMASDEEFMAAFEKRWEDAEQYRRNAYTFRILPKVSLAGIIRYQNLAYRPNVQVDSSISQAVADYIVYLVKMPMERMIFHFPRRPTELLKSVLYWTSMPMLNKHYSDAIQSVSDSSPLPPWRIVDYVPASEADDIRNMVYHAVETYDFAKGSTAGSGTAFSAYLKTTVRRYFRQLANELMEQAQDVAIEDEVLKGASFADEHAADMLTSIDGDLDEVIFLANVEKLEGPDGEKYLVLPPEGERATEFFRLLSSVDGFLKVNDLFPQGVETIAEDACLLRYSEELLKELAYFWADEIQ